MTQPTNLVDGLRQTAAEFGNDRGILLYTTPETTEYRGLADLEERARAIAHALRVRGYGVGDTVVVGLSPTLAWAEAAYGVLFAGAAFVPAPVAGYGTADMLGERIAGIAKAADATLMLTDDAVLDTLGGGLPGVDIDVLSVDALLAEGDAEQWTPPEIGPESLAFLLFTSGSTGDPKGVIGAHGPLFGALRLWREDVGIGPDAVYVGWAPLHHIMGLYAQIILPASNGAMSVIQPTDQFQRRPMSWLQLLSKHKATLTAAGNFAFGLCAQLATDEQIADLDLSRVRFFSGSEPVRPETVRAFVERFRSAGVDYSSIGPAMGMTEATIISAVFPGDDLVIRRFDAAELENGLLVAGEGEGSVEWVSCGRPPEDARVVIVDPDTEELLPEGQVGEIWVSSPLVSPGYFRRPDATAETFGLSLEGEDALFMRTGDLAAFLDGQLYVTGRVKDLIIIRGRNIYPQDLEAAARDVSPAIGIGSASEVTGQPSPVAIVLEVEPEALGASGESLDALAGRVRDDLVKRFSLPSLGVLLVSPGAVPRTPTGKVRRLPTRRAVESGAIPALHAVGVRTAQPA